MQKINTIIFPIIRSDFIGKALQSVHEHTQKGSVNIIVIDQTSDNTAYNIYRDLADIWVRPIRNLGFSKAMNTGIRLTNTDYITLCNDDVQFINGQWWQGILDTFATDKRILAVNPMSPKEGSWGYGLSADNYLAWQPPEGYAVKSESEKESVFVTKDGQGIFYPEEVTDEVYDFLLNKHPRYTKNTMVDAIAMWCTVFKREGLFELGLLDERFYPGGGEDYDMNCRAYSCAYPTPREVCDPEFHRRMVSTTRSWVWHHWGKSKDAISAKDPENTLFASRERWNNNHELWGEKFDVWGHETLADGTKKPLKRIKPIYIDQL
jgi:GT2 family glycosyltransferase